MTTWEVGAFVCFSACMKRLIGGAVSHSTDKPYLFGDCQPKCTSLSEMMMDYWLSFATSLDLNDGKGSSRPGWNVYATKNATILQF
jgi:acetylcholinesterase